MKLLTLFKQCAIPIMGKQYEVRFTEELERDDSNMGGADVKRGYIRAQKDMPPDITEETLLHEVLHILNDSLDIDLKEKQICSLSTGLYCFLKENKLI